MKLSKNWLKDYLNLDKITDEELQNIIGFHVCEIEAYKKMVEATNLSIGKSLKLYAVLQMFVQALRL